jgi:hypothetical protein
MTDSKVYRVRKEYYNPSTGKWDIREQIVSSPIQKADTATGADADLDVLTYTVTTGKNLYIYKLGLNGGDDKTWKIIYGTTVLDYIAGEAGKQYSAVSTPTAPLYVIPGGQTVKIQCINATASTAYNASFAGVEM